MVSPMMLWQAQQGEQTPREASMRATQGARLGGQKALPEAGTPSSAGSPEKHSEGGIDTADSLTEIIHCFLVLGRVVCQRNVSHPPVFIVRLAILNRAYTVVQLL